VESLSLPAIDCRHGKSSPPCASAAIPVLGPLIIFRLLRPWFLLPRAQMIFESNVILELTQ